MHIKQRIAVDMVFLEMKNKIVIRPDDVPNSHTVWSYIESHTNVVELFDKFDPQPYSVYELTLD